MKYLLDTCSLLWFAQDDSLMSDVAFDAIEDPTSEILVSSISFWELSMKSVTGRLTLSLSPSQLESLVVNEGMSVVPLLVDHIDRFQHLPATHRDAFDRLLAAIALEDGYTIITPDTAFDTLDVTRVW